MDDWLSVIIASGPRTRDADAVIGSGRVAHSYADALDELPIVAFIAAVDGSLEYISRGWTTLTGYGAAEALGFGYLRALHPADADRIAGVWRVPPASDLGYSGEYCLRLPGGLARWVLIQIGAVREPGADGVAAWFGTITDIDDYKRVTEQLQQSESLYRAFAGALPGVTWAASPAGDLTFVGDRWLDIHADSRDRALGDAWLESVHPDDRERVSAVWAHSLQTGADYKIEFRVRLADGSYHWFLVRALPVRNDAGVIVRWVGVNIDIEDRHAADAAREMYAALVENSSDFIAIADTGGHVIYVNGAGRELLEIGSHDEVRDTRVLDYFLPGDRAFVEREVFPALARAGRWQGDVRFRNFRTGAAVPVAYTAFALAAPDGTPLGTATVSRDLRDRKRIEEGLRLLSRTGAAVVDSLDYQRTLRNIAGAFVDGFAAYCLIDVMSPEGAFERTADHRDPAFVPLLMELSVPRGNHPVARAIATGASTVTAVDDAWARNLDLSTDRIAAVRALRVRSIISVPVVTATGTVVGALTCALDDRSSRENYGPADLAFVEEVGRRAGAAIANVQRYERERRVALEFQAASLPARLPALAGVALDAAYRPASSEATIGGDWYDAFLLDDGRLVITAGDVLGHGLHAAVSMTKLRLAMQSAAMVDADPHVMLRVADATLRVSDPDAYATAVAAVYDPAVRTLTLASAGHPNPILRTADGCVGDVEVYGLMIGLRRNEAPNRRVVHIAAGATVIFYTDGLIEFERDVSKGLQRLSDALGHRAVLAAERPAEALVAAVLGNDDAHDDIAVLVATFA